MRKYTVHGGTLEAPDEIVFAFNPCFLNMTGISASLITIYITEASYRGDGQQVARLAVHPKEGKLSVDISAYIRSEFAGLAKRSDTFKTTANLSISIDGVSIPITVVYGAILPGEVFNPSRNVRLWSAYPQVISFYHPALSDGEVTIYVQKDDAEAQEWWVKQDDSYDNRISNYDNQAEETPMQKSGQIVIYNNGSPVTKTTFSAEYDGTFTGIDDASIINVTVDSTPQCDDHIFLRWLDKWGFWQYWLCKVGSMELTDAVVGSALTFFTGTTYPYYATRNIGKSMVKQVSACATNLTEEEWQLLSTIKGSVNVCAYDVASQSWVPVNVAAGASAWKMGNQSSHRQDFPLKVVFPTIQTQRL